MATPIIATGIVYGTEVGSPISYIQQSYTYLMPALGSVSNLILYFRMQGYDTISGSMKTWIVYDTPDPNALRYTAGTVSITNAFIVDRWYA